MARTASRLALIMVTLGTTSASLAKEACRPQAPQALGTLRAIATISSADAWAAGYGSEHALTMHWDGDHWETVPSQAAGPTASLEAVAAIGPDDVWAVGSRVPSGGGLAPLAIRWDGTSWVRVPVPGTGQVFTELLGVSGSSDSDVWAVGHSNDGFDGNYRTLTMHWDGSRWAIVPSPSPGNDLNGLADVTAISGNEVWAVGWTSDWGRNVLPMTLRWTGSDWEQIPSPRAAGSISLRAGDASSRRDMWAVGLSEGPGIWAQHWDGSEWKRVRMPSPNPESDSVEDVAAIARGAAWAVGWNLGEVNITDNAAIHWKDNRWVVTAIPSPGDRNYLYGVDGVSDADVWAVGTQITDAGGYVTILHWDGTRWTLFPVRAGPGGCATA